MSAATRKVEAAEAIKYLCGSLEQAAKWGEALAFLLAEAEKDAEFGERFSARLIAVFEKATRPAPKKAAPPCEVRWNGQLITEMSDGHVCNVIRVLARDWSSMQRGGPNAYNHEYAARGPGKTEWANRAIYKHLVAEAWKRGLMP